MYSGVEFQEMTTALSSPFSTRNRHEKEWIEEDFPASARTGLLHLLSDAVDRDYISGWIAIAKELGRMARAAPRDYDPHYLESVKAARSDAGTLLNQLGWDRIYDFCERLHSHLAQGYNPNKQGRKALADQRLNAARKHFSKSLRHFRDREKPDLENSVKEAVCAVEAAAKELFPDAKVATLGNFVKWATGSDLLPKTIGQTFTGLYAFRNSGEGVSHGATLGGVVTAELSEYVLGMAASQIILLADLARGDEEPPF